MTINDSSFEEERLAQEIAEYMVGDGTQNTYSCSYFYSFDEINRVFGTFLPDDDEMLGYITDALLSRVKARIYTVEGFEIVFRKLKESISK